MRKRFVPLLICATIVLALSACGKTSEPAPPKQPSALSLAHRIPKLEEKRLDKQVREDLQIVIAVRDDTATLEKALAGEALRAMSKQIQSDLALGRIKVRSFGSQELSFSNYTKGVAGYGLRYIDESYYVGSASGKTLTTPTNEKRRIVMALKKTKGRWRIIAFLSAEVKKTK